MYDIFMADHSSFATIDRPKSSRRRWYKRWWGISIILIFIVCFILFAAFLLYVINIVYKIQSGRLTLEEFYGANNTITNSTSTSPQIPSLQNNDSLTLGSKEYKIQIVEFIDYECPGCSEAHKVIGQLIESEKYKNIISVRLRHFPLIQVHPNSIKAAMAVECANEQYQFRGMHDKLLENQKNLSDNYLKLYSVQLGLKSMQFSACLDSNQYAQNIESDYQAGMQLGVNVLPTFFIGEIKFEGVPQLAELESIIDVQLNKLSL